MGTFLVCVGIATGRAPLAIIGTIELGIAHFY